MPTISSLLVSRNTVLHPLELSDVFSPDFHARRAGEILLTTLSAEHFCQSFLELTLHFTKITSTYTALTNCILNYAFQKGGTFSVHRNAQSRMQLQTNVTTLMNSHVLYV